MRIPEGQIASAVGFSLLVRALILIIGPSPLGLLLFRGMDIAIVDAEREQLFSGTTPPDPYRTSRMTSLCGFLTLFFQLPALHTCRLLSGTG